MTQAEIESVARDMSAHVDGVRSDLLWPAWLPVAKAVLVGIGGRKPDAWIEAFSIPRDDNEGHLAEEQYADEASAKSA